MLKPGLLRGRFFDGVYYDLISACIQVWAKSGKTATDKFAACFGIARVSTTTTLYSVIHASARFHAAVAGCLLARGQGGAGQAGVKGAERVLRVSIPFVNQ